MSITSGSSVSNRQAQESSIGSQGLEVQPGVDKHAIPRKWRENPKGNKEIWESSVRSVRKRPLL